MVLGESLEDADGKHHAMTGLLGHATSFAKRKLHLGYRTARLLSDSVLGKKTRRCAATNFIMPRSTASGDDDAFAELRDGEGRALGKSGGRRGNVTGTFFHAIAATSE